MTGTFVISGPNNGNTRGNNGGGGGSIPLSNSGSSGCCHPAVFLGLSGIAIGVILNGIGISKIYSLTDDLKTNINTQIASGTDNVGLSDEQQVVPVDGGTRVVLEREEGLKSGRNAVSGTVRRQAGERSEVLSEAINPD